VAIVLFIAMTATAQRHGRHGSSSYDGPIPQGTPVQIRMIDALSSANAKPGQTFRASLDQPIVVNGRTLYPKGADVTGRVIRAHSSGRLSDPGELELVLTQINGNPVTSEPLKMKGESHTKSNVTKIGGGAAAGAIIGGIAGGGKGAAIGAGVGAAGGTAVAAATGKKDTTIQSEAVLGFVTATPPAGVMGQGATPAAEHDRYRERGDSYDDARRSGRYGSTPEFGRAERDMIRQCMGGNYGNLPPGLAKRGGNLPPGLEKQVQRNGQLPPGLQKRVTAMPESCTVRLPRLPVDWVRVILGRRVLMLDPQQRIADLFSLDEND
jgi:hypothetical protein